MNMLEETLVAPAQALIEDERPEGSDAALALAGWRDWVTAHRLGAAFLAGLIATHMATIIGYWLPSIGLPRLDWNLINGAVYLPQVSKPMTFWTGGFFHYTDGLVFTIVYAVALHPAMPWRWTSLGNLAKGLVLGTALAVISCIWMIPRVYAVPHAGFFSANLGWKLVLAVFVWHWVYGLNVGLIYNPRSPGRRRRH
jgi:hypothetical protein